MEDYNNLSEEDKRKVDECERIRDMYGYTCWSDISDIAKTIENPQYREIYRSLAVNLYHMEEASCGLI